MSFLVFWQNSPSIHQAPFIREVARLWEGETWIVAELDVSTERMCQGWARPDFSPANLVIAPNRFERLNFLKQMQTRSDVHIFSGFHAYPETYWTLKQVSKGTAQIGVFVERGKDDEGFRSFLRRIRYMLHSLRWNNRLDFILGTGSLAVEWFARCGFCVDKIYPFSYFVEEVLDNKLSLSVNQKDSVFELIFVGSLSPWKGLDLLFYALSRLENKRWSLRIIGEGQLRSSLEDLSYSVGISNHIFWDGVLSNSEVRSKIATADLLVLPSYYDGWGAVINEALMAGTPVVVSNACGACDLVQAPFLGAVFASRSIDSLASALRERINEGKLAGWQRQKIIDWSENISPRLGAKYFLDILSSLRQGRDKPSPPWEFIR